MQRERRLPTLNIQRGVGPRPPAPPGLEVGLMPYNPETGYTPGYGPLTIVERYLDPRPSSTIARPA